MNYHIFNFFNLYITDINIIRASLIFANSIELIAK